MLEQIKKMFASVLEFWGKLSKRVKILVISAAIGLLVFAGALTLLLNRSSMVVLYTGLTPEETTEILGQMQTLGINSKTEGQGVIMVDSKVENTTRAQLATLGYPKSGLAYTYLDDVNFLSTDYDKKQAAQKQTETQLAGTIALYDGVKNAKVTLALPEKSSTVLNMTDDEAKASVFVETSTGKALPSSTVEAITTLVAASVPRLNAENVSITDQGGNWLKPGTGGYQSQQDIELYQLGTLAETRLREDVERVLALPYGPDGALVTVRVELTRDDEKTQSGEYKPNNADGTGGLIKDETKTTIEEGVGGAGGIPGADPNAQIPTYPNGFINGNFFRQTENNTNYVIDFVEKQLQTVGYRPKKITIAAIVNEPDMTEESRTEMTNFLATAIGASPADVAIIGRSLYVPPPAPPAPFYQTAAFYWLLAAGVLVALIFAYLVLLAARQVRRNMEVSRQKKEAERLKEEDAARIAAEEMQHKAEEAELARMKAELDKISLNGEIETKEQKIREEIRDFAKENPEIVAQIVKTLLKNEYD